MRAVVVLLLLLTTACTPGLALSLVDGAAQITGSTRERQSGEWHCYEHICSISP